MKTVIRNIAADQGIEHLEILYRVNGKEDKATFENQTLTGLIVGGISRAESLYFADWQKTIEDLRNGNGQTSDLDDLEKLSGLKDKGIITEDEFKAKKKQLLGL